MSTGEPDTTEIGYVRFGGGPSEKGLVTGASLATYPTSRRDPREPRGAIPRGYSTHRTIVEQGKVVPSTATPGA
jgi:hypothetical protein